MATERQIEANRRNAQHSTGPRTPEGKAACRGNALKHGLAGDGVVVAGPEAAEIARRTAAWTAVVHPANELEAFLLLQAVTESVRVERCQGEERALLDQHAGRADDADGWEESRRLEAEETGARLARDPSRTVCRLRQTVQGCDWLLRRWDGLGRALEAGRSWDDAQRSLALDLLGLPHALRTDHTLADPSPCDDPSSNRTQQALVAAEVAELRRLKAGVLAARDEHEREAARLGVVTGDSPTARALGRLRRYESACQRRLDRSLRSLLPGRGATSPAATVPAAPAPLPQTPPPAPPMRSEDPPAPVRSPQPSPSNPPTPEPPRGNRRWRKAQARRTRPNAA